MERELKALRLDLRTRELTAVGDLRLPAEVELWVHPDDRAEAWSILRPLLAND